MRTHRLIWAFAVRICPRAHFRMARHIIILSFSAFSCGQGYYACPNKNCIPDTWLCDGDFDCDDGSDELTTNCLSVTNPTYVLPTLIYPTVVTLSHQNSCKCCNILKTLLHEFLVVLFKQKYSFTVTVLVLIENHHQTVPLRYHHQTVCDLVVVHHEKHTYIILTPLNPTFI